MSVVEKSYFPAAYKDPIDVEYSEQFDEVWSAISRDIINESSGADKEAKIAKFLTAYREDAEVAAWRNPEDGDRWESRDQLIRFLRAGLWDVEAALKVLRSYLASGRTYISIVRVSIPTKLEKVWNAKLNAITDYRDKFGRRIYIYRPGVWEPADIDVNEFMASQYVMFELLSVEVKNQLAGVTCVADMSGFGFKHIRNFGMEQIKCMTNFMSGGFPLWVRKIHVVNAPRAFGIMHNMMKPLLDERVKDNMVFHGSDYTELHKEVPAFLLPTSMGGQGDLDNSMSVKLLKERNHIYQEIVDKSMKHSTI